MTNAITYALMTSLKSHINSLWGGDLYDTTGTRTQEAFCPEDLIDLLRFTDKDTASRIFGPSKVLIGRLQEDPLNIPNHLSVPSSYIEIAENDYEEVESWRHTIYESFDGSKNLGNFSQMAIGGEMGYTRRFIVKMSTYFLESNQGNEEVSRLGNAAASFLESLITSHGDLPYPWAWMMNDSEGNRISDPFGEVPWRSIVPIVHTRRRGGSPDDFIFDAKFYVEVSTFKNT